MNLLEFDGQETEKRSKFYMLERLKRYFNVYYSNVFSSIDTIRLEYLKTSKDTDCFKITPVEIEDDDGDSKDTCTDIKEDKYEVVESLNLILTFYKVKSGHLKSFFIYPLEKDSLTYPMIKFFMKITEEVDKEILEAIKVNLRLKSGFHEGFINLFNDELRFYTNSSIVLGISFSTSKSPTFYNLNFNTALNYL